jgi:hypothetical protein
MQEQDKVPLQYEPKGSQKKKSPSQISLVTIIGAVGITLFVFYFIVATIGWRPPDFIRRLPWPLVSVGSLVCGIVGFGDKRTRLNRVISSTVLLLSILMCLLWLAPMYR